MNRLPEKYVYPFLKFLPIFINCFFFESLFFFVSSSIAQDTLSKKKLSPPRRASIYSAVLPGLGQAYNRSWWKIPIIYAGLGSTAYFISYHHQEYQFLRKNLRAETDQDPQTINTTGLPSSQLSLLKQQHKNRRDLFIAGMTLVYLIQILDAHVDAHLKTFDISDDVSFSVFPEPYTFASATAICFTFKIRL